MAAVDAIRSQYATWRYVSGRSAVSLSAPPRNQEDFVRTLSAEITCESNALPAGCLEAEARRMLPPPSLARRVRGHVSSRRLMHGELTLEHAPFHARRLSAQEWRHQPPAEQAPRTCALGGSCGRRQAR
jgi:hypothetical protein